MTRSKKSGCKLPIQARPALVARQGLVDGEIHLAALHRLAALDLAARVAEGRKDAVLGLIHQNVAVGEVKDPGPAMCAGSIPAGVPQLPANLEGHGRLAGAGGHGEQLALAAAEDAFHGAVDGDFLVVAFAFAHRMVHGREQTGGGDIVGKPAAGAVARP